VLHCTGQKKLLAPVQHGSAMRSLQTCRAPHEHPLDPVQSRMQAAAAAAAMIDACHAPCAILSVLSLCVVALQPSSTKTPAAAPLPRACLLHKRNLNQTQQQWVPFSQPP
jgi:hypothetical protein